MVEQWGHRIVVLGLLLSVPLQSQKILSDKKKCADPHCESLMFRAQAIQDYNGPDCRYLSFKVGAEIIVYYKLSGKREDLWQGSTGKEYGFFPMHTVTIEEIYVTEEVEVDAQEIDFVCLNGGEYVFENEDSVLLKPEESEYARDLESKVIKDNKFVGNTETNTETNIQTSENLEEIDKSKWSTSSIAGWFGIGESEDKQSTEINTEPVKEDTFHSRKIAISEEMEIKGTDEVELKKSGWLSSQFTNFLPFGKREVDAPVQKEKTDDVVSAHTSQSDEMKMNVKEIPTEASTSTEPQSKWFNFAIKDVFGVGSKDEVKIKDVHEHGDIILENEPSEISSDGEELTATNSEDREETFDETKSQEKDEASPKENTVVDLPLDDKIEQMYAENTVNSTKTQEENIKINEFSADGTKEKHKILSTDNPIVSETFRTELSSDIGNPNTDCDISSNTKIHKTVAQDFLSKNELSEHSQELETAAERIPTFQPGYDTLKEELDLPQENTFHQGQKLNARMEKASESTTLSFKVNGFVFKITELTAFGEMAASEILEIYTNWICPAVSSIVRITKQVMSTLSDLLPDSDFYGCSWEVVAFTALFGFSTVLLFTCRTVRSIKSRCYAGREKKLSAKFSEAVNGKSEVLQKLSIIQKQYEEVQQSLEDSSHQRLLAEITEQKTLQETLQKSNCDLEEKILKLEQELEEEKALGLELETKISNVNEKIKTLEDDLKKGKSQKEEIHTTMKVFEINQGRLETSSQDAIEERSHLQESIKQLSKEAEGWEERFSELAENSKMLSSSVDAMHEDMNNKQIQIKSLIDNLLKMKDWGPEMDEVEEGEDLSIPNLTWDFENGESLADPQKRTIKKLIYAAMLNASLRSTESEKKQLYDNLSDEMKVKEQLLECINNLQNTKQSLISEKEQLEGDVENMKHKMSVMSEMYQENEKKLHRKLTVQEKERIQKEEKLSKVDEKIHLATGELLTVKTRVKELEDEIEKTVYSYQSQVTSYEKKSHDNWLTARAAERHLSEIKKETAHFRQKLIEAEYKVELLEKDPFALDVIHAIGRAYADVFINHQDSSPYGISPISRLPDSRAFLSPPTLLEGPLRLSPMLPGVDRGVRPPGYYPAHGGVKERGDINADRKADQQRTHSDAGSLSPPWERDHKASMPPPGLPYPELPFPSRRPERFYQYPVSSGRFSGPAELTRNQGISFTDLPDGQSANTIRNGSEDNDTLHGSSNQPLLKEGETADVPPMAYAVHPLPPMRVPLLPMDPRGPYFRRPFPMQPPPVDMYPPPEYPGIPPIHATMRSPLPPHHYPPFPMHGDQFFPPPHLRQPIRSEHLPDPPPVASETQEKPPEPTA
ncbi:melanoma inhibitory activity protein 2 isoform X4 [Xenopus tropicalis]|uniref:Melanoma inhibitory activity protein 2 isoform X4 n=1 Tax=Xenopus tropicalis TaxID=8364 RepID=A0A8J0STF1_XENTR|nr:melanoma inhibitory activity protein 2 isoform X4 [Xenopus tropicalis]